MNLTGSECVSGWYFNLSDPLNPNNLKISETTQTGNNSFSAPTVSLGANSYKADGSGKYDFLFSFASANNVNQRFMASDSITFAITGIAGLTASDFDALCCASAGMGPFYSALQVCSIGTSGQSGWVSSKTTITSSVRGNPVPDGSVTMLLLGFGLFLIEGTRRVQARF